MNKGTLADTLRIFIPVALAATALLAVSYVNNQQILRGGANEPQKGMAEDLAQGLGNTPGSTYTADAHVAIESSLSPYLVIFDSYGNPVGGTGYLDGALPTLPAGLFDLARTKGEDTLTWQPETGVRSAIVLVPVDGGAGGFVMGGRSLTYVEQEESMLTKRSALGWVAVMLAALIGSYLASYRKRR